MAYEPTQWRDGDLISAEKLNKLEAGVAAAGEGGGSGDAASMANPVFTGSVSMGREEESAVGNGSTALGRNVNASGLASHAEGIQTKASSFASHAEGNQTTASSSASHAEGEQTTASGGTAHAEGTETTASGGRSHAECSLTTASGYAAHAEGEGSTASGDYSHAEGYYTLAGAPRSHASGFHTIANGYDQFVMGHYNVTSDKSDDLLIVGKGLSNAHANCFRVTQTGVFADGNYNASGADYAELFEWADGNPDAEDRVGRFVTLTGERIRLAGPGEDFVLGIISSNPSVLGNVQDDQWGGMFQQDIFGRPLWEEVFLKEENRTVHRQKLNPDYDSSQKYIPRTERQEWAAVGLLGKLIMVDDGSCTADSWCAPGEDGIAVASTERTRYRVLSRLDDTHIRVLIL